MSTRSIEIQQAVTELGLEKEDASNINGNYRYRSDRSVSFVEYARAVIAKRQRVQLRKQSKAARRACQQQEDARKYFVLLDKRWRQISEAHIKELMTV